MSHPPRYRETVQFHYSHPALAVLALGIVLATIPAGRADVAIAGFVAIWVGMLLFRRQSVPTIRYWATLMAAVFSWFALP